MTSNEITYAKTISIAILDSGSKMVTELLDGASFINRLVAAGETFGTAAVIALVVEAGEAIPFNVIENGKPYSYVAFPLS